MTETRDTLLSRWRRFHQRPAEERAVILRATILLPLTGAGLRVFGFRRWKEWIERFSSLSRGVTPIEHAAQLEIAARAARAVRSVELHGPATPNCLERSMTLWWLLRRDGVEAELHVGARKISAQLEAHAWVEFGGKVLNDSAEIDKHYSRFDAPIVAAEQATSRAGAALKAD